MTEITNISTISLLNELLNQGTPRHPLISVVDFSKTDFQQQAYLKNTKFSTNFYAILLKTLSKSSLKYGRAYYDFQEGSLFFISPNQVLSLEKSDCIYGWGLYFHPDLIKGTSLVDNMSKYTFFNYHVNEALHLSEEEKATLSNVVSEIQLELQRPIDKHSKTVLVSSIELLLNYCMRFYDRQFITRSEVNKSVIEQISVFLHNYFQSNLPEEKGLPTVTQCAQEVNLSNNYLTDLLRKETGKSTQEHIHYYLIEAAKNRLLNFDDKSISEIAHELGFEYPQYFSKIFKKKVGLTPLEYRKIG